MFCANRCQALPQEPFPVLGLRTFEHTEPATQVTAAGPRSCGGGVGFYARLRWGSWATEMEPFSGLNSRGCSPPVVQEVGDGCPLLGTSFRITSKAQPPWNFCYSGGPSLYSQGSCLLFHGPCNKYPFKGNSAGLRALDSFTGDRQGAGAWHWMATSFRSHHNPQSGSPQPSMALWGSVPLCGTFASRAVLGDPLTGGIWRRSHEVS